MLINHDGRVLSDISTDFSSFFLVDLIASSCTSKLYTNPFSPTFWARYLVSYPFPIVASTTISPSFIIFSKFILFITITFVSYLFLPNQPTPIKINEDSYLDLVVSAYLNYNAKSK